MWSHIEHFLVYVGIRADPDGALYTICRAPDDYELPLPSRIIHRPQTDDPALAQIFKAEEEEKMMRSVNNASDTDEDARSLDAHLAHIEDVLRDATQLIESGGPLWELCHARDVEALGEAGIQRKAWCFCRECVRQCN